jgi:hypothetical protein
MERPMCKAEEEHSERERRHAVETWNFLGNTAKLERKRAICRAFLRTIGVSVRKSELKAPPIEQTDVAFRAARFRIRVLLDEGRRRGDDWKEKEKKLTETNSIDDLLQPCSPPTPMSLVALVPDIGVALSKKALKYGAECNNSDALVYVNLRDRHSITDSSWPTLHDLKDQGWRSVSLLFPPYAVILFAKPECPEFLKALRPGQYRKWENEGTLFETPRQLTPRPTR